MFVSLKGGLQKLIDAIIAKLPKESLVLSSPVKQIKTGNKYKLVMNDGKTEAFDAVIMATPAHATARLLDSFDSQLSEELAKIEHASSAILNLVYKRSQIPHPLDGFGFVIPHSERRSIIACTFSSIKFPGRAPSDTEILRVFMGGSLAPHMTQCSDATLTHLACAELHTFLGIDTKPILVHISRYDSAMPQYVIGHQERVHRIMKQLEAFPGLTVAGNGYHGVGIPDCIHSAELAAETIHAHLARQAFVPTV
jgi:oxygen-dependent protoporphyrinogen oxidase